MGVVGFLLLKFNYRIACITGRVGLVLEDYYGETLWQGKDTRKI